MYNVSLYKAQIFAAQMRRRARSLSLSRYSEDLTLFTMVGVPLLALGLIFRFAYTDRLQITAELGRLTDLTCLAQNIYFEARGESLAGQRAVAEVTMNRVRSKRFPDSVCAVVHEQRWDSIRKRRVGAFSWTELDSLSKPKGPSWQRATMLAVAAYEYREMPTVPGALYYHAVRITPRWSRSKKLVAQIGSHKFYE